MSSANRTEVFISYSHKDKRWLDRLQVHLKPLERAGIVHAWDDTRIKTGQRWEEEINSALARARFAVLLVSADFLASDFIADNELPPILASQEKEGLTIMPVILSPCRFRTPEPLAQFQAVNDVNKPLDSLRKTEQEAVFEKLVADIEKVLPVPPR